MWKARIGCTLDASARSELSICEGGPGTRKEDEFAVKGHVLQWLSTKGTR